VHAMDPGSPIQPDVILHSTAGGPRSPLATFRTYCRLRLRQRSPNKTGRGLQPRDKDFCGVSHRLAAILGRTDGRKNPLKILPANGFAVTTTPWHGEHPMIQFHLSLLT